MTNEKQQLLDKDVEIDGVVYPKGSIYESRGELLIAGKKFYEYAIIVPLSAKCTIPPRGMYNITLSTIPFDQANLLNTEQHD